MDYKNYSEVPWYRTEVVNIIFLISGLLLSFFPLIWATAIILLTGDIYKNKLDTNGNLVKWAQLEKTITWIIFALSVILPIFIFIFFISFFASMYSLGDSFL